MTTKVGFIGLGAMGLPMASNLQRKGFQLKVFDLNEVPVAKLVRLGAQKAGSVGECSRDVDVVVTMLPATQHVEAVVLGSGGVLENISPGSVLMDMSTIDARGTDRVAKACAQREIGFTDCPVGRLVLHAEKGESLFMVGADDTVFARVEPLLQAMGTAIYRCGAVGMGSRMKLINNFMLLSTAQIVAESLTLGTKLGLDVEIMRQVTAGTTAHNGQFHVLMVNKVLKGDIEPGFTIDLAFKDMTLAMNAAAEQRMGLPVGAAAHAVYGAVRGTAYASKDYSALLAFACEQAGVTLPSLEAQRSQGT
jgi:4-hydroxybutyrate dehydrogenase/sulfolactaldehyde 3-reductase